MDWKDFVPDSAVQELRELRRAPYGVAALLAFGFSAGWLAAGYFYAERFAVMEKLTQLNQSGAATAGKKENERPGRSPRGVVASYGGGAPSSCAAILDSTDVKEFADKFDLALVCGVHRPNKDRYTDTAITVSPKFHIGDSSINVDVPASPLMKSATTEYVAAVSATMPLDQRRGLAANVTTWYTAVLLPKEIQPTDIHALTDVSRLGGRVVTDDEQSFTTGVPLVLQ